MISLKLRHAVAHTLSSLDGLTRRQIAAGTSARLGTTVESWDIGQILDDLVELKFAIEIPSTLDSPPRWVKRTEQTPAPCAPVDAGWPPGWE